MEALNQLYTWLLLCLPQRLFAVQVVNSRAATTSTWICRYPYSPKAREETYPHPRDCYAYVACQNGYPRVMTCPLGMYYVPSFRRCDWPTEYTIGQCDGSISAYIARICKKDSYAKVPLPDSCALYTDCSLTSGNPLYYDKILECPYPDLFSPDVGRCVKFWVAKCGKRPVPVAPCDYLQYRQTCTKPTGCLPCSKRHPSCKQEPNGPRPVPEHKNLFKLCISERTLDVRKCLDRYEYNPFSRKCSPVKRK